MIEVILREDIKTLGKAGRAGAGEARATPATTSSRTAWPTRRPRGTRSGSPRRPSARGVRNAAEKTEAEKTAAHAVGGHAHHSGQGGRGGQALRLGHRAGRGRRAGPRRATRWTVAGSSSIIRSSPWAITWSASGCTPRFTRRCASPSSRSDPSGMSVGIAYVDGPRLARSVFAAADWVAAGRDEINRINVFPGPRRRHRHQLQPHPARRRRRPPGARRRVASGDRAAPWRAPRCSAPAGNSGMMLAHFLLGFSESLGDRASGHARPTSRPRHPGRLRPALRIARRPSRGHHPDRRPGGGRGGRARGGRLAATSPSSCAGCSRKARRRWRGRPS